MIKRDERGFSLIELAVVVAIIGILAAIAIPTFLGQRKGAQDRAAHSALRNMMTIAKAAAANTDSGNYPGGNSADLADTLNAAEPQYTIAEAASTNPNEISVNRLDPRTLVMAAKSASGACWFVVTPLDAATVYAVDHETDNNDCDASRVTPGVDGNGEPDGTFVIDGVTINGTGFGSATDLDAEIEDGE